MAYDIYFSIFKVHVWNSEQVRFLIMNLVLLLVVAWHFVGVVCMDKCIQRWKNISAEISLENLKFHVISFSNNSAQSIWLKRYPRSNTTTVYISQNFTGSFHRPTTITKYFKNDFYEQTHENTCIAALNCRYITTASILQSN